MAMLNYQRVWDLNGIWMDVILIDELWPSSDTGTKISKSMIIHKSYSIFCELLWAHDKFNRQSPFGSVWWVYGLLASDAVENTTEIEIQLGTHKEAQATCVAWREPHFFCHGFGWFVEE